MTQVGIYSGDFNTAIQQTKLAVSGVWPSKPIPGKWYIGTHYVNSNASSANNVGADTIYCYPFLVGHPVTVDRIAYRQGVAFAGASMYYGVYGSDPVTQYPTIPKYLSGAVDISGGAAIVETAVSFTLEPGLYYTAWVFNALKSMYFFTNATTLSILGLPDTSTYNYDNAIQLAYVFAALPNPFPGGGSFYRTSVGNVFFMYRAG